MRSLTEEKKPSPALDTGRGFSRRGSLTRGLIALSLALLLCAGLCGSARAELSGGEQHLSWTESPTTQKISTEEAAALTGASPERIRVLWSVDYSTESYPVAVRIKAHGLDGLPLHVFEYVDGAWLLLGSGIGPELEVTVNEGGPLSVVTSGAGTRALPEDAVLSETAAEARGGDWLPTAAGLGLTGLGLALFILGRKKL